MGKGICFLTTSRQKYFNFIFSNWNFVFSKSNFIFLQLQPRGFQDLKLPVTHKVRLFFSSQCRWINWWCVCISSPFKLYFFFFFCSFFNITFLTILFRLWSTSTTISPVWALSICYFVLFLVSCELSNLYLLFIDCEWHRDWRKGWEKETSSRYAFHLILFINNY